MKVDRPVGIDLGTTNSEIALLDPSERDILVYADRFGRKTVPSAIAWDAKRGELVVGRAARARRGSAPGPIESIKRSMGHATRVEVGPHTLSPEEVSSKILGELRDRMREDLQAKAGEGVAVEIARAVITVPAYFDAPQVEATRRAGELAGLDVLGILQEPTAAAIYHAWRQSLGDGVFLVYDLGGGTFDVSVLRCLAGEYQVLAIDGDNYLGGDDFDRRFAERLRAKLVARGHKLDLAPDRDAADRERWQRLVHLAQEIKETLATSEVVSLSRQNLLVDQDGEPVSIEEEIGRAEWDEAVADLVETTIECARRAIERSTEIAGVGLADVDHVVLVGGSTRAALVAQRVHDALVTPSKGERALAEEVDTCVALGAAVHAALLGGLRVSDDRASLHLAGTLVSRTASGKARVVVERAPAGAASLVVLAGDEERARAPIDAVPSARVDLAIALDDAEETRLVASLRDASDVELASLPFALYRGELRPRPSALSQPSVMAKDIALEVARGGRRERKVLIARGTSLPVKVDHELATGDRSGAVVLRLLQNRLPIKTLLLEVPADTPIGAPVRLTLSCDDAMRLEAHAEVAGRELWARVEPAPESASGADEIEALLAEAERVGRQLWGRDAIYFRRDAEPLTTGLREVLGTDPGRRAVLTARLRELVERYGGAGDDAELAPPLTRFEGVLDALRRVVFRNREGLLGESTATWESRLAELDERAHAAWTARDAIAWRRAYNEAQALYETASTQEHAMARVDDPAQIARRALHMTAWLGELEVRLADFVPSTHDDVRARQLAERDRLTDELTRRVRPSLAALADGENDSHATRRAIDAIAADLERIDAALERLPRLGLVTDR